MNQKDSGERLFSNKELKRILNNPNIFCKISASLQQARNNKGWTQAELARRAGMQQAAIARLENPGYTIKYLHTLEKIAKALGVELVGPVFKNSHPSISSQSFTWHLEEEEGDEKKNYESKHTCLDSSHFIFIN